MKLLYNGDFCEELQSSIISCETCSKGKLARQPFGTVIGRTYRPLKIIHTDVTVLATVWHLFQIIF